MKHGKLDMPLDLKLVLDYVGDSLGRIMVVVGFLCIMAAVSLFSKVYQWSSVISFVLGVLLIVVGINVHYEPFTLKVPSIEGWGNILICVSAIFMASAVAAVLFAVPGSIWVMPTSFRRGAGSILLVDLEHPNTWLAPILAWTGVGLFILGFLLKMSREIIWS